MSALTVVARCAPCWVPALERTIVGARRAGGRPAGTSAGGHLERTSAPKEVTTLEDAAHIKGSPMDVADDGSPVVATDEGSPVGAADKGRPVARTRLPSGRP